MSRCASAILAAGAAIALTACNGYLPSPQASARAFSSGSVGRQGAAPAYRVLYRFGPTTANWPDALVRYGDKFYGLVQQGGAHNMGAVFTVDDSGNVRFIYQFGTNHGRRDANGPVGALTMVDGIFYGVGSAGGTAGAGAIFRITPAGDERVIYNFRDHSDDGIEPYATLIAIGHTLYGTTAQGGFHDRGTIFSVTTNGTERVLHAFLGYDDGIAPYANLTRFRRQLYGVTSQGGRAGKMFTGCGTAFAIDPSGAHYRVVHRFTRGADGCGPSALLSVGDALYGTTGSGGTCKLISGSCGTVFRMTRDGNERVLYSFQGRKDGDGPGGLIAWRGSLYGTTGAGGGAGGKEYCGIEGHGCGTIFRIDISGRNEQVLHAFAGDRDGAGGGPLIASDAALYGTTVGGGSGETRECGSTEYGPTGCGTIFRLAP